MELNESLPCDSFKEKFNDFDVTVSNGIVKGSDTALSVISISGNCPKVHHFRFFFQKSSEIIDRLEIKQKFHDFILAVINSLVKRSPPKVVLRVDVDVGYGQKVRHAS